MPKSIFRHLRVVLQVWQHRVERPQGQYEHAGAEQGEELLHALDKAKLSLDLQKKKQRKQQYYTRIYVANGIESSATRSVKQKVASQICMEVFLISCCGN